MINGEKEDYTMWTSFSKLASLKRDSLGDVYFRHLEPINLHEYLQKNAASSHKDSIPPTPKSYSSTALELTMYLMEKQNAETPVTLNALISAILLQEENSWIMMSTLLEKATVIYDYLKVKPWLKTYMTVSPKTVLVQK